MINKIKIVFCLISCVACLGGTATAQTRGEQTAVSQTEINNMIGFYEWALESKFTDEQRTEFGRFMEKDFADDAVSARAGTNEILATWTKIKRSSEEVRRRTRGEYLRSFLPKLKQIESEDASARFLLDIFRREHGGRETFTDLDEARFNIRDKGDLSEISAQPTASELAGKWYRTAGTGGIGDGTGKTKYGTGERFTFEFFENGAVEYTVERKTLSITNCRIESLSKARGTISIDGDSMTMNLNAGPVLGMDSCDPSGNYRKKSPKSTTTVKFRVKKMNSVLRPDNPTLLCFGGNGGESCFERNRE